MSSSIGVLDLSFVAEADLSSSQYCAVKLGTDAGQVNVAGTSDQGIGVLQNKPTAGQEARVRVLGTTLLKANGAFGKGDVLAVAAATGKVDTVSTQANVIAIALQAATAQNDEVEGFMLQRPALEYDTATALATVTATANAALPAASLVAQTVTIEAANGAGAVTLTGFGSNYVATARLVSGPATADGVTLTKNANSLAIVVVDASGTPVDCSETDGVVDVIVVNTAEA